MSGINLPTVGIVENKTIAGFMFNWIKDNCNLPTDFTFNFNIVEGKNSIGFIPEKSIGIYERDVYGNYEAEFPFSIIVGVFATDDNTRSKPFEIIDGIATKFDEVTAKLEDLSLGYCINIDSTKQVLKMELISSPTLIRRGEDGSEDIQSVFKLYYKKEVH